jgi:hypothetical protein
VTERAGMGNNLPFVEIIILIVEISQKKPLISGQKPDD